MLSEQKYGRGAEPGVRPSPIFIAILLVTALAGWVTTADIGLPRLAVFVFVAGAWTLSIIFHEFAHAFLAWRGGDRSVPQRGYLTLDPRKYTHPVLSFGLPLLFILMGGIGLPGGAVLLNRSVLSDGRASVVALAGPFTNLMFGCGALALIGFDVIDGTTQPYLASAVGFFGFLQIAVFVLNMLPIPGFDGYAAIEPTLSPSTQQLLRPVARYGALVAILMIWRIQPVADAFWAAVTFFTELFGVQFDQWRCGYFQFKFWDSNVPPVCR
ncbi:MAG: site-2 protease family protein [Acidimicrobiales bacterium]